MRIRVAWVISDQGSFCSMHSQAGQEAVLSIHLKKQKQKQKHNQDLFQRNLEL